MLWPAFHFHSVLLIFVNLWPISTLCVADMVHAVADMVCGRYHRFPFEEAGGETEVGRRLLAVVLENACSASHRHPL